MPDWCDIRQQQQQQQQQRGWTSDLDLASLPIVASSYQHWSQLSIWLGLCAGFFAILSGAKGLIFLHRSAPCLEQRHMYSFPYSKILILHARLHLFDCSPRCDSCYVSARNRQPVGTTPSTQTVTTSQFQPSPPQKEDPPICAPQCLFTMTVSRRLATQRG
ncbi:hypothetical protein BDU57DRAFT_45990 [Ampelomyces quisqualis]|uniref:Uncharacterized protein n=1 Tax=Ampelomyces quisqualis TaxID=50730 RepID=A0A6A5R1N9_AMPQU|nr:hypothetical protein BDU57DRAFT_45990 [Ampelomyces quisqualis]